MKWNFVENKGVFIGFLALGLCFSRVLDMQPPVQKQLNCMTVKTYFPSSSATTASHFSLFLFTSSSRELRSDTAVICAWDGRRDG